MSTIGQFSSRNPTIKRILKEASELANQPSAEYHAAPLESDLFEWHFTIRGPPAPSPYEGGLYHGRIVLPPAYPLKPPSFRFVTPSGRFEVNREICLSISGHHEETWQPAWGIRTALVAIRSFMDTDAMGQLGGMDTSGEVRRRFAEQSRSSKCAACGKTNAEIMREQEENVKACGEQGEKDQDVPDLQLKIAYRDELAGNKNDAQPSTKAGEQAAEGAPAAQKGASTSTTVLEIQPASRPAPDPPVAATVGSRDVRQQRARPRQNNGVPGWIDKAICAVVAALVFLIWKKYIL